MVFSFQAQYVHYRAHLYRLESLPEHPPLVLHERELHLGKAPAEERHKRPEEADPGLLVLLSLQLLGQALGRLGKEVEADRGQVRLLNGGEN